MPSPATQKKKTNKQTNKQNTLQLSKKITTPVHFTPDPSLQRQACAIAAAEAAAEASSEPKTTEERNLTKIQTSFSDQYPKKRKKGSQIADFVRNA
jgi:hypothetical protein